MTELTFSYLGLLEAHPSRIFLSSWIMDFVKGFVITLRKSGGLDPVPASSLSLVRWSTILEVIYSRYPVEARLVTTSTTTRTITVSQLNMSWTVAAEKALSNSALKELKYLSQIYQLNKNSTVQY